MSRVFNGSSDYLENGTAILTGYPVTLSAWVYPTTLAGESMVVTISNSGTAGDWWQLLIRSNGQIRAREGTGGGANQAAGTSTNTTTNVWAHVAGQFVGTAERYSWLNAGGKGTNTNTEGAPASPNVTTIGRLTDSTPGDYFTGRIAEVAIWNAQLTDAEIVALAGGAPALSIRPTNLVGYWPLLGEGSPEPNYGVSRSFHMTVTGATQGPHAPAASMYPSEADVETYPPPAAPTTKNYYAGGIAASQRLTRGIGWKMRESGIYAPV